MYILHVPLIWYVNWLDWATVQWRLSHPVLLFFIYLGLVVGLSWVAFVFLEEPARIELRKRLTAHLTGNPPLVSEKQPVAG
jgi:peptidoglycan/LPS O-acetylase OafA/YrhL